MATKTWTPPHWDFGGELHPTFASLNANPTLLIHQVFCFISFGCANLQTVWERSHSKSAWQEVRTTVKDRLEHINVVVRLPQPNESAVSVNSLIFYRPPYCSQPFLHSAPWILQWIRHCSHIPGVAPYCLLLASMGFAIAGIAIGSSAVFIVRNMSPLWFREVCPFSNPPLRLLEINRGLGLSIGCDGINISKSWKIRYNLAAPVIEPPPRQGLITYYIPLSVP